MPRINRANSTTYGKRAVNQTTEREMQGGNYGGWIVCYNINKILTLSGSADAFPERKVTDQIHDKEAHDQLPFDGSWIVDSLALVQLQNVATEMDCVKW